MFIRRLLIALFLLFPAKGFAADSTVAALAAASALAGSELFYCVQSSADKKCTAFQISTFVLSTFPATTCTNQFVRSIAAATGAGTCATVNFALDGTGVVPAASGGAGTVNGALAANGSGAVSQAASTQLSDTTAKTTWTPTDQSGAALSLTVNGATFAVVNKTCTGAFRVVYPTTVDATAAKLSLPCTVTNNSNMAIGSCFTTATSNFIVTSLGLANTATVQFLNTAGANSTNVALTGAIISCNFAFNTP